VELHLSLNVNSVKILTISSGAKSVGSIAHR